MIEAGARRREIDEAASELFHANGYAATSVRDIARALDIQGASLYAHVASKEDVLWSIVDRDGDRASSGRADAARGRRGRRPIPSTASPPSSRPTSRWSRPTRERASVFVTEWRHLSPDRRAAIARTPRRLRGAVPRLDRGRHRASGRSARPTPRSRRRSSSPP